MQLCAFQYLKLMCVPCAQSLLCTQFFTTPLTVAHQVLLSMGFSRQEDWSGCHFLLQGILPIQGLNPHLLYLLYWQADSLPLGPWNWDSLHNLGPWNWYHMLKIYRLQIGKLVTAMHEFVFHRSPPHLEASLYPFKAGDWVLLKVWKRAMTWAATWRNWKGFYAPQD